MSAAKELLETMLKCEVLSVYRLSEFISSPRQWIKVLLRERVCGPTKFHILTNSLCYLPFSSNIIRFRKVEKKDETLEEHHDDLRVGKEKMFSIKLSEHACWSLLHRPLLLFHHQYLPPSPSFPHDFFPIHWQSKTGSISMRLRRQMAFEVLPEHPLQRKSIST